MNNFQGELVTIVDIEKGNLHIFLYTQCSHREEISVCVPGTTWGIRASILFKILFEGWPSLLCHNVLDTFCPRLAECREEANGPLIEEDGTCETEECWGETWMGDSKWALVQDLPWHEILYLKLVKIKDTTIMITQAEFMDRKKIWRNWRNTVNFEDEMYEIMELNLNQYEWLVEFDRQPQRYYLHLDVSRDIDRLARSWVRWAEAPESVF